MVLPGRKITLTVRYPDFNTFTKQSSLPDYTNHTHVIFRNALTILDSVKLKDNIRLLGVSLSSLTKDSDQMLLFEEQRKGTALLQAMDTVNDKYGDFRLIWASYLEQRDPPRVISPAWKPSGIRHICIKR